VFTPLATFTGTATLQYQVEDSFGNTGTATMTVTVNPFAPTNLSYTTPQNQPLIINVPVKEASNVPVGTTFTVASNPLHGTLTINNDGTYTYDYTPSTQSYTADSFTYKACLPGPNQSVCSTKTVSITLSTTGGNLISQPSLTLSASTLNTACYRPVELYVSGGGGTGAVGISATSPNGAVCQIYQSGGNWFLRIASANGSCQVTATKAGSTVGSNTYSPLTTETPANNVITVSIN
jgi:VCBS repeat-containing protein